METSDIADKTAGLHLKTISCTRGYRELFNNLDVRLCPGQILRVEGRNGSGKTSLLRIMAGLAQPLEGEVLWDGHKIHQAESSFFQELLFIGHRAGIKYELTPVENLRMTQSFQGGNTVTTIEEALYQVGLYGFEDTTCAQLSAGQKRRVALAQLFLTRAKCWILDEPYTSLDVAAVSMLETRFAQHVNEGGILVITSHQPINVATDDQHQLVLPKTMVESLS